MIFVSKHYIEKLKGANLMKKTWTDAAVEELVIEATAGGAQIKSEHDGVWQQDEKGNWWEATTPVNS